MPPKMESAEMAEIEQTIVKRQKRLERRKNDRPFPSLASDKSGEPLYIAYENYLIKVEAAAAELLRDLQAQEVDSQRILHRTKAGNMVEIKKSGVSFYAANFSINHDVSDKFPYWDDNNFPYYSVRDYPDSEYDSDSEIE